MISEDPPRRRRRLRVYEFPAADLAAATAEGRREKSVCVIGAGIAGLVSAYELLKAEHSVTVVDADHRVGGRIRTWHSGEVHAELGPMRIPVGHEGTMHYVKEMGCKKDDFVQANANAWVALRGQKRRRYDWEELLPLYGLESKLFRAVSASAFSSPGALLEKATSLSAIFLKAGEERQLMAGTLGEHAEELASQTFRQALMTPRAKGGRPVLTDPGWELIGQATSAIREERVSGLEAWVEDEWTFAADPRFRLTEGMEALPRALRREVEALGGTVEVGRRVSAVVTDHDDDMQVICADGEAVAGGPFDYVICAVPAAATRRIEFDPPLAPEKDEALGGISYFSAAKSLVLVNRRRWESDDEIYGGASYTDRSIQQCWYPSDNAIKDPLGVAWATRGSDGKFRKFGNEDFVARDPELSESPAILTAAYMSGTNAERFTSMTAPERDAEVLRHLEFLHPGIREDVEGITHCCWIEESTPHGGAWTIFEPGKQERYLDGLRAPHPAGSRPRVFFAGEHLSVLHGWMQSAIQSSLQAAIKVLEAP